MDSERTERISKGSWLVGLFFLSFFFFMLLGSGCHLSFLSCLFCVMWFGGLWGSFLWFLCGGGLVGACFCFYFCCDINFDYRIYIILTKYIDGF